jgi:hypothetical protein
MTSEVMIRQIVREEVSRGYLYESSSPYAKETMENIAQLLVAGAAEYGIAIGSAGTALPAAPIIETLIDSAFATEEVAGAISTVNGVVSASKEMNDIINEAKTSISNFSTDPKSFYETIRKVLGRLSQIGGAGVLKRIKETAQKLLSQVSGAISDAIKMVIPDAIVGATVGQGILTAVNSLDQNCYDILMKVVQKLGKFGRFITSPEEITNFFNTNFPNIINAARELSKKIDEQGLFKTAFKAIMAGPLAPFVALMKLLGPAGLNKFADYMEEKQPQIMQTLQSITSVLIPTVIGAVAAVQSAIRGDYKSSSSSDEQEAPGTKENEPEQPAAVSERRRMTRELNRLSEDLHRLQTSRNVLILRSSA